MNTKTDAKSYQKIAREIFAPIYPVIAQNIIDETGVGGGLCIDLGAGPGNLGIELARLVSDLSVVLYDMSEDMLRAAERNIDENRLSDRVTTRLGKAEELPFPDNTADLIVSRGSIFFWEDQAKGIREAYRVLKPKGAAYIGGGFGSAELFNIIKPKMLELDPDWEKSRADRTGEAGYNRLKAAMEATGIKCYEIRREQAGLWIIIKK